MPSLRALEAWFCRHEVRIETWRRVKPEIWAVRQDGPWSDDDFEDFTGPRSHIFEAGSLAEADGVWLLCPKCYVENGGAVGTHSVICWFVGKVPDDLDPKPGRWIPAGSGLDDLTFIGPAAASVLLTSGCGWHGFVKKGRAE